MPRRGENIYKRNDGRWEGRILKPNGKYQYVYAQTYKEVKEKKKKAFERIEQNHPQPVKNIPANQLFEDWLTGDLRNRVKPTTYESYYRCLTKYIIPFFKESANKITEDCVRYLVKNISNNQSLSESYKRKILSVFKTALREILKGSNLYDQIISCIKLPRASNKTVEVFSVREQKLIENTVINSKDRTALGILLCFYTGIRLGELCGLKWEDIDMEVGTMYIKRTVSRIKNFENGESKTLLSVGIPKSQKSIRKIPIPAFFLVLFKELNLYANNENHFILSGTTTPMDPRTYQKLFQKYLNYAGVKKRKFHAIRHTFATRALELGIDIKTLSEILGHANVSITLNIYTHSLFEQKKKAIDKLNEMYIMHSETTTFAVSNSVITA